MNIPISKKKKKKNSSLIIKVIAIVAAAVTAGIGGYFLFVKKDNKPSPQQESNLGEQQNQQTQSAVLQLASNLLDNSSNLNQLTKKSDGTAKTIQEIEEEFLISAFQPGQSPVGGVGGTLPPEVIERMWWELRPWVEEYLQDLNRSILEHAREKFQRDVEKWLKWQQREYNRQLEEYQRRLQELQKIEDLIREYQKIREQELLDKISRKTELRNKGYIDRDIEKLREWGLITPDQEIPDLNAENKIGATNILWTSEREYGKIGGSSDLIIFLKPKAGRTPQVKGNQNNSEMIINFSTQIAYEDKEGYKQFVRDYLTENEKFDYDACCLIRTNSSMSGPSAGIAYYLALYSLINRVPLPRNLGSTGTVFERPKVGGIGGLDLKLEYNVKKEKPINTFILSIENKKDDYPPQSWEDISFHVKNQVKQVHFVSSAKEIITALNEILNNAIKEKVHVCGKEPIPEKKPERNRDPPSEITSEQLLSLITELSIREKQGENQDFWEKLQASYAKNVNYQGAVNSVIRLHKEYREKIQNDPQQGNENSQAEIKRLENQIAERRKMLEGKLSPEQEQQLQKEIGLLEQKIKELKGEEGFRKTKTELEKEYASRFSKIASSVSNLTNKILTSLTKNGYTIAKITWTGELHVPSLTAEPAVSFSLTKKG